MGPIFKVSPDGGHQSVFQPGEHSIAWLGLEILKLQPGETWQGELQDEEAALVILGGRCEIAVEAREKASWSGLGARPDIFAGNPTVVYAPRRSKLSVKAETKLELAIAKSPCTVDLKPVLVMPSDVKVVSAGMANWRRDVRLPIPPGSPISQRLIVGETINPPGNWSGIPPHKHEENSAIENFLEEFYLFKTKPADGYGLQLIYKGKDGQGYLIGNDNVAVMLQGYHPTVAAPGVTIGYLWTLAGDSKAYDITTDPRFDWVANAEAVLKELQK